MRKLLLLYMEFSKLRPLPLFRPLPLRGLLNLDLGLKRLKLKRKLELDMPLLLVAIELP